MVYIFNTSLIRSASFLHIKTAFDLTWYIPESIFFSRGENQQMPSTRFYSWFSSRNTGNPLGNPQLQTPDCLETRSQLHNLVFLKQTHIKLKMYYEDNTKKCYEKIMSKKSQKSFKITDYSTILEKINSTYSENKLDGHKTYGSYQRNISSRTYDKTPHNFVNDVIWIRDKSPV